MVSNVAEGSSVIDECVIAEVARLLAYVLVCANAVLGLVKNVTPFFHRHCGSSGKRSSLSDCGRYQTLTSKLLRDREDTQPNKLFPELCKAAITNFFFQNLMPLHRR